MLKPHIQQPKLGVSHSSLQISRLVHVLGKWVTVVTQMGLFKCHLKSQFKTK